MPLIEIHLCGICTTYSNVLMGLLFITHISLHKYSYHIPFSLWDYYTPVCVSCSSLIRLTQMVFAHIFHFYCSSLWIIIFTLVTNVMVGSLVTQYFHILLFVFLQVGFVWGSLQLLLAFVINYNLYNNILLTSMDSPCSIPLTQTLTTFDINDNLCSIVVLYKFHFAKPPTWKKISYPLDGPPSIAHCKGKNKVDVIHFVNMIKGFIVVITFYVWQFIGN